MFLLSLVTSVSFGMKNKLDTTSYKNYKFKISSTLHFGTNSINNLKISSNAAKILFNFYQPGNQSNIYTSEEDVNILIIIDNKQIISVWDLEKKIKIYEIPLKFLFKKIFEETDENYIIFNVNILEKNKIPFLKIMLFSEIWIYDIRKEKLELYKKFENYEDKLEGSRNYANCYKQSIKHKSYTLEGKNFGKETSKVTINYKNAKKVSIDLPNLYEIFASPKVNSKYILICSKENPDRRAPSSCFLYNNQTGKCIKNIFKNKKYKLYNEGQAAFNKDETFIKMVLDKSLVIYDLIASKVVFKKTFDKKNHKYLNKNILTQDEKLIIVPSEEYIYFYNFPAPNKHEKQDNKERISFLREKFGSFQVNIDGEKIKTSKLFLRGN